MDFNKTVSIAGLQALKTSNAIPAASRIIGSETTKDLGKILQEHREGETLAAGRMRLGFPHSFSRYKLNFHSEMLAKKLHRDTNKGGTDAEKMVQRADEGKGAITVPGLEAGRKRSLADMEHPAKRSRVGGSSSGSAKSSAVGSDMDAAAAPVPPPEDAPIPPPQDAHVPPPQDARAPPQDAAVPPPHHPLPQANREYAELVLRVKPSVVTVSVVPVQRTLEDTKYRTGFIVSSTNEYAIVFTSLSADEQLKSRYSYHVNLEENIHSVDAEIIAKEENSNRFCLLLVPTEKKHQSVNFLDTAFTYQRVFTLGAKAGTRLRFDGPVIDALVGKVGQYDGRVLTPTCSALTLNYKPVRGSDDYFEVKCNGRDTNVQLASINNRKHTANRLASAPVFDLSGKVGGMIDSAGTYVDVKNGFKSIVSSILSMCGKSDLQEGLLLLGNEWYAKIFGNA